MVYWTAIKNQGASDMHQYQNETYRARHGFKEMHIHNAPKRKNKDFKPLLYGDYIGMLNFKLAEPWALFRHLKDMFNEEHQMPLQYIKTGVRGAVVGVAFGLLKEMVTPLNHLANKKLVINTTQNPFKIQIWKYFKGVASGPSLAGASLFLLHRFFTDLLTHHKHSLEIPSVVTEAKVWLLLAPLLGLYMGGPKAVLQFTVFAMTIAFPTYTFMIGQRPFDTRIYTEIYYQDGVSKAEKDLHEYTDNIEELGYNIGGAYMYDETRFAKVDI